MDERLFWQFILGARSLAVFGGHSQRIAQRTAFLTKTVAARGAEAVADYARIYYQFNLKAYDWGIAAASHFLNVGLSDDTFEYFRGWLIAQGKQVYFDALRDPDTLADYIRRLQPIPPICYYEAEDMLYVPYNAYKHVHGEDAEFEGTVTLDGVWTDPAGEDWKTEANARNLYPKLAELSDYIRDNIEDPSG